VTKEVSKTFLGVTNDIYGQWEKLPHEFRLIEFDEILPE